MIVTSKDCKKWKENKLINPKTNRKIKKDGPTYRIFEEKCDNDCLKLGGFSNIGGTSCYMDSVLFALLAVPNKFVTKNILQKNLDRTGKICPHKEDLNIRKYVQTYLNNLQSAIIHENTITTCTNLRKLFRYCNLTGFEKFGRNKQQEAGEFLMYLLQLFNSRNFLKQKEVVYGTNSMAQKIPKNKLVETTNREQLVDIIYQLDFLLLKEKRGQDNRINYFFKKIDDSGELSKDDLFKPNERQHFRRKISNYSIIDSPYIIIWAQRVDPISHRVLRTKIIPTQQITLQSKRKLQLSAIVVHHGDIHGGHYITLFNCKEKWYRYDDLSPKIDFIGSYRKMMENEGRDVKSNGVLYFYTQ